VTRHFKLGHPAERLIATLALAVLREDAGFHAYQMLEAGVRQFAVWGDTDEGRHILIAVARYLAAHSPTERAALQTADIARRLTRGGECLGDVMTPEPLSCVAFVSAANRPRIRRAEAWLESRTAAEELLIVGAPFTASARLVWGFSFHSATRLWWCCCRSALRSLRQRSRRASTR